MNKDLPSNFPCKCGHAQSDHSTGGQPNQFVCLFYYNVEMYRHCKCYWYTPDNLVYLERLCQD